VEERGPKGKDGDGAGDDDDEEQGLAKGSKSGRMISAALYAGRGAVPASFNANWRV